MNKKQMLASFIFIAFFTNAHVGFAMMFNPMRPRKSSIERIHRIFEQVGQLLNALTIAIRISAPSLGPASQGPGHTVTVQSATGTHFVFAADEIPALSQLSPTLGNIVADYGPISESVTIPLSGYLQDVAMGLLVQILRNESSNLEDYVRSLSEEQLKELEDEARFLDSQNLKELIAVAKNRPTPMNAAEYSVYRIHGLLGTRTFIIPNFLKTWSEIKEYMRRVYGVFYPEETGVVTQTPIISEKSLAESVIQKGSVMGELRKGRPSLKPQKTKTPGQWIVADKEKNKSLDKRCLSKHKKWDENISWKWQEGDEEKLFELSCPETELVDENAQKITIQLPNSPYTQTEAHYELMMMTNPLALTSIELTNQFLKKFITKAVHDSEFKEIVASAIDEEKRNKGLFVFYHATKSTIGFYMDVVSEFIAALSNLSPDELTAMRAISFYANEFETIDQWIEWIQITFKTLFIPDHTLQYKRIGLSVNPFLFGGTGSQLSGESTLEYFYAGASFAPPDIANALDDFLEKIGATSTFEKKYKPLYDKYLSSEKSGRLLQIFVDAQSVDQVSYSSTAGGFPWTFIIDGLPYQGTANILASVRQDPSNYLKLTKESHLKVKTDGLTAVNLVGNISDYQCRLFLKDRFKIKTYWRQPLEKVQMEAYQQELKQLVKEDIVGLISKKPSDLSHSLSDQSQKLIRLHKYAYNGLIGSFKEAKTSTKILLQRAIESGDTDTLKEIIDNYPEISNEPLIHSEARETPRSYVSRLLNEQKKYTFEFLWILFLATVENSNEILDFFDEVVLEHFARTADIDSLEKEILPLGDIYKNKAFCFIIKYGNRIMLKRILMENPNINAYHENIDELDKLIDEIKKQRDLIKENSDILTQFNSLVLALKYDNADSYAYFFETIQNETIREKIAIASLKSVTGTAVLKYLLADRNIDLNLEEPQFWNPNPTILSYAIQHCKNSVVECLIQRGATIYDGFFFFAVQSLNSHVVQLFIDNDKTFSTNHVVLAIVEAASSGNIDVIDILFRYQIKTNTLSLNTLYIAHEKTKSKEVKTLIEAYCSQIGGK